MPPTPTPLTDPGDAQHAAELLELGDALVEVDGAWRVIRVNRNQERLSGTERQRSLGRALVELLPEVADPSSPFGRELHRCMAERVPVQFLDYSGTLGLWTGVTAYPTGRGGVVLFLRDVTAQKRAEEALREASRRKDEFLGLLSHELRNPLAPIQTSVHTLARTRPESEQATRARAIISRQVRHLTRLVDDLLDVKRISTGKLRLRTRSMDLVTVVRETVEDLRPEFARRGVALELDAPPEPVAVKGDPTRLAQAVGNLLSNAVKFTNPGGRVVASVARRSDVAELRVRDDGVGIDPPALATLFDPFVQAETTLHRSRSGLGLGLALVKGIAELHGGAVAARSDGRGKGAEFVVTLPAVAAPAGADRGAALPAPGAARRVLVVDDDADAAESLRDLLQAVGGHDVRTAASGEAALDAIRAAAPDVLLCDVGLSGIDGYELARRIRGAEGTPVGRLVALTGRASPEDVDRALRAGFDYHVAKPPDLDRLLRLVADAPRAGAPAAVPPELVTGHHEVDAQHAAILAMASELRTVGAGNVWEALRFLEHYTASHFEYEERLMEDVGFPRLHAHRETHLAFTEALAGYRAALVRDGPTPERIAALAAAVERWVTDHVLGADRHVAEFVRGRGRGAAQAPGHAAEPPTPARSR